MASTRDQHGEAAELYQRARALEREAEKMQALAASFREQADAMMQAHRSRARRGSGLKGIEGVPQEVFDIILDNLPRLRSQTTRVNPDLLGLRSASRKLNQMTIERIAELAFKETTFIISDETDLSIAIELASHPIYGPAMRKVTLNFDEMPAQAVANEYFAKPAKFAPDHELDRSDTYHASPIDVYGSNLELVSKMWMEAKIRQRDFISNGSMAQGLVDLFSTLRSTGKFHELQITEGRRDGPGDRTLWKKIYGQFPRNGAREGWGLLFGSVVPEEQLRLFKSTLEALVTAGLEVPVFDAKSGNFHSHIDTATLAKDAGVIQIFQQVLRNTHELRLNVSKCYDGMDHKKLPRTNLWPIVNLITGMPLLRTLHLDGEYTTATTIFVDAVLCQELPRLRELFLWEVCVFQDRLEDFVARHPRLDLLALLKCRLYTETVEIIREEPELLVPSRGRENDLDYVKSKHVDSVGRLLMCKDRERWDYDRLWSDYTVDRVCPGHLERETSGYC